jgi:hypothetical protein
MEKDFMKRFVLRMILILPLLLMFGALLGSAASGIAYAATTKTATTSPSCDGRSDFVRVYVGGNYPNGNPTLCFANSGETTENLPLSGVSGICSGNNSATFFLTTSAGWNYNFSLGKNKCSNTYGNDTLNSLEIQ